MLHLCDGQLKLYSNVTETPVDCLWYPYIPFGKITMIQGDPGCGKSTLMMNIIAGVSNGSVAPDGRKLKKPMHVIYQCSEDGLGDTITPRLNAASASGMCRVLRHLSIWVAMYDCAVVLIGHLSKKQNSKELYHSMGSIDLVVADRSVIQVERLPDDDSISVIHPVKSSLSPKDNICFFYGFRQKTGVA